MQPPIAQSKLEASSATAGVRDYISLLRPSHWIKNVVVFAGPAAGMQLFSIESCSRATLAFLAFCLVSSASYALNDVVDRRADATHPTKRQRPVARGAIRPVGAVALALALLVGAALLAILLGATVLTILALYFVMTLSYTLALKRRIIMDVIIIATGFVLRAWAGAAAVDVETSQWLVACMFTLSMFMGFGKRRCEVAMLGTQEDAEKYRATLVRYTPDLLNHLITVSAGIAIVTFLLYTLESSGPASQFPKEHLFYTLPVVVYGVFRFAMLSELGRYTGPTEIVLKDRMMTACIVVWTVAAVAIAYQGAWMGKLGL